MWKSEIVDSKGHYILESHKGLINLAMVTSITQSCILPLDCVDIRKALNEQLIQLSGSGKYRVSIFNFGCMTVACVMVL